MRCASGWPVVGSGTRDASSFMKLSSVLAVKAGTLIMTISKLSFGSSKASDRPRTAGALSGARGLPPPFEKRAVTGMRAPGWRGAAVVSRAPPPVETNSPLAQTPLAPLRRLPAWVPDTFSIVSTIASGDGSCAPAVAAPTRSAKAPPDRARSVRVMQIRTMACSPRGVIAGRWWHAARPPGMALDGRKRPAPNRAAAPRWGRAAPRAVPARSRRTARSTR
jgi:hypothetical protein